MNEKLAEIVASLEEIAGDFPTLIDMADADTALMYLRHIQRRLNGAE